MSIDHKDIPQETLPNGLIRRALPLQDWPAEVSAGWRAYCRKCDDQKDGLLAGFDQSIVKSSTGSKSCRKPFLAPSSRRAGAVVVGRWLHYAQQQGLAPEPNAKTYVGWLAFETDRGLAPKTVATEAQSLWRFCTILWPDQDWSWMSDIWQPLKKKAKPRKDKQSRLRPITDIEDLGFQLMNEAVAEFDAGKYRDRAAVKYRDGLMLAMWAQKPLRLANMTALKFADFEFQNDGRIRLNIEETKNDDPDEATYDEDIRTALDDWKLTFRPILSPSTNCDRVWIGRLGAPMETGGLYQACIYRTKVAFGMSVSPHLMRDCTARTIAEHSPDAAHIIGTLLGHRDQTSSKHYLGHAMMIGGAKSLNDIWDQFRIEPAAKHRRK